MSSPTASQPAALTDFLYDGGYVFIVGFFYGIHFILVCLTVPVLWRRKSGDIQAKRTLLALIISMFALATVNTGLSVASDLLSAKARVLSYVTGKPEDSKPLMFNVEGLVFYFNILLGDCIVLWRAWVLCAGHRKIVYVSILLQLGTAATWLALLVMVVRDVNSYYTLYPFAIFGLSACINILSTAAIGYKVWLHRTSFKQFFTQPNKRSRSENVLVLILDTGVVYSLVWVVGGVLSFCTLKLRETSTWSHIHINSLFDSASRGIVNIYPTVLVALILIHKSFWDLSGEAVDQSPSLSEISFSRSRVVPDTDTPEHQK